MEGKKDMVQRLLEHAPNRNNLVRIAKSALDSEREFKCHVRAAV
jgi:hypothetical protein